VIGGMLQHIEFAGVHSGDAAMVLPPHTLSAKMLEHVRQATYALAKELHVVGLMNVQFAIKDDELYVLEVNPRASRTIPFVSKTVGVPLAKLAARVMAGEKLVDLGFTKERTPPFWAVKEAVFPFVRFPGAPVALTPEMRSTGEVMGLDLDLGIAYAKTQMAAQPPLPEKGQVFMSVKDSDKAEAVAIAKELAALGFTFCSTSGTARALEAAGIPVRKLFKLQEGGRPTVIDLLKNGEIQLIINTPFGQIPRQDENSIRSQAVLRRVCIITTLSGAYAALQGIKALRVKPVEVRSLQEYGKMLKG
jgi:carbamoyl-phosphate synthase large subunit